MIRKLIGLTVLVVFACALVACGDDPDPRFRVTNNYSSEVNISYKLTGSNTVNMNGIATGTTSEWKSVPETTVSIENFPADKDNSQEPISFATAKGYQYTVVIAADGRASVNKEDQ